MGWDQRPLAIFLMGPTAVGKTELACQLREHFPCDLISVDSALVYRGLNIGAAKPAPALLERHPHALIDIRDPAQAYSAADFQRDAIAAMQAIQAHGRVPLLVGGTGLYFRALQRGLSPLPSADPALRQRLAAEAERLGWEALHQRLRARDPQAAARIGASDAQRIQRALEVIELSGRPLSALQAAAPSRFPWRVLKLGLWPEQRADLHQRIAQRFQRMLEQGLVQEVAGLRARGDLNPELPAIRAVGYRQVWEWLEQESRGGLASLHARGVAATRQLAKRQLTWLRGEWDLIPLPAEAADRWAQAQRRVADFLGKAPRLEPQWHNLSA